MPCSSRDAWPGSRTQLIDKTNLGKYFFEVVDREDAARPVLARFCVDLRRVGDRSRVPHDEPHVSRVVAVSLARRPVRITLKKRDPQNVFQPLWTTDVDPRDSGAGIDRTHGRAVAACSRTGRRTVKSISCSSAKAIRSSRPRRSAPTRRGWSRRCSHSSRSSRAAAISTSGRWRCAARSCRSSSTSSDSSDMR